MPTIATSQLSTSLSSGNLANVDGPANLGTIVPLIGWIGSLFVFFGNRNAVLINYPDKNQIETIMSKYE